MFSTVLSTYILNAGNRGLQGGGLKLIQISQGGNLNSIHILECMFTGNTAQTGAGGHLETFLIGQLIDPVAHTRMIHVDSW